MACAKVHVCSCVKVGSNALKWLGYVSNSGNRMRLEASFTGDESTLAANAEYMLATAGITWNGCRGSIEYNIAISGT